MIYWRLYKENKNWKDGLEMWMDILIASWEPGAWAEYIEERKV